MSHEANIVPRGNGNAM